MTDEVLNDLGCGDIPQVTVYNKCDRTGVAPYDPDVLLVSAKSRLRAGQPAGQD